MVLSVKSKERRARCVSKKEVAWQNVAAREHGGQLKAKALSSISENRWCEYEEESGTCGQRSVVVKDKLRKKGEEGVKEGKEDDWNMGQVEERKMDM